MIHSNNRSNNLKSDVDSLNIDNLETTPVYLIKLSNVLKKKNLLHKWVKRVDGIDAIDTSN